MAFKRVCLTLGVVALLAACQASTDDPIEIDTPVTEVGAQPNPGGGFNEREPDTCGADNFQTAVGQSREVIPGLGVTREIRIISPGDIVTQEYNPVRMNFYVNNNGIITQVTCG